MHIGWKTLGKYTDDKEPIGTAGKPIYTMLERENIINVLVIVVRYFGGILLGTGPLTRAYMKAATLAVQDCNKEEFVKYIKKEITVDYSDEKEVIKRIEENNGKILHVEYAEKIKIIANVPEM